MTPLRQKLIDERNSEPFHARNARGRKRRPTVPGVANYDRPMQRLELGFAI
jgi:hypothetical protein